MTIPAAWARIVDDAAIFPPGDAQLEKAVAAYAGRSDDDGEELVGSFVVRDTDLPRLKDFDGVLSIVVTGGAGQLAGPTQFIRRTDIAPAGMEIAVRDPDDLAGNVRRIVVATDELETEWPIFVELTRTPADHGWLVAADVAAEAGLRLKFRTGGLETSAFPSSTVLAGWINAALDRETEFKCTAGLHRALRHTDSSTGFEHHGFLNVLVATRLLFDGASLDDAVVVLEQRDGAALIEAAKELDLVGARRWFTSFGSCSVAEPLADLRELGLLGG